MKNVHIYNIVDKNRRYPDDLVIRYLKAQVDNSLRLGWRTDDIIIGSNFDFEYRGVKNYILENVCNHNIFYNKFYGMLELMDRGILTDDFWFHDQDNWQIEKFSFPEFDGEIGACSYVFNNEWNTGSLFVKKTAAYVLRYIVDFMELYSHIKTDSDENVIAVLRVLPESEIKNLLTTIDTQYNVGFTHMIDRYNAASKPVYVCGFQPNIEKSILRFSGDNEYNLNFISSDLLDIFNSHSINGIKNN